jgi:itaconate CoA-transferase
MWTQSESRLPSGLPLAGIRVLALEQAVAAPFATRQLADLGARVVKLERPGTGDFARHYDESVNGLSSYFIWLNRSKESVTVDLKSDAGRQILHELIDCSDVVVQNLGPGAAARLGVTGAEVRAADPTKIVLTITGWGSDGPWSQRKAYDLLVQCEAGLVSLTGAGDQPARVGISVADIAAGMYGFSAILTALYRRQLTGEGATIEVALFDALVEWLGQPVHFTQGSGRQPPRAGLRHATIAPYGPFVTVDSETLVIAIQNEPEWERFCRIVLTDASVATDPRFCTNTLRVANRTSLDDRIAARIGQLPAATATSLLDQAGIAFAGVNGMEDLLHHPVLRSRDRWRPVATARGTTHGLLPPATFAGQEEARMGPVPGLGAHTDHVLAELGYEPGTISSFRHQHVI